MTCQKCQGLLVPQWDGELRVEEWKCLLCSWRPAYAVPLTLPPDNRGRHKRETSIHVCDCGRAKVPWRSSCRDCLDRRLAYERMQARIEKERQQRTARKEFS